MNPKRLDALRLALPLLLAVTLASAQHVGAQEVTWMLETADWKYYQAGDEPADDGDGDSWRDPGYNDATWPTGGAILGFGNGNEVTDLTRGAVTYYFRSVVSVSAGQLDMANQLVVNVLRDDGVVVYVNGVEIRRDNMEGREGDPVAYDDLASAGVAGNDEKAFFETTHLSELVFEPGVNTVAVEVHQNSPGSSDLSFAMRMEGFSVIPLLGLKTPPAPLDFSYHRIGDRDYSPIDNDFDPYEIGWMGTTATGEAEVHDEVAALNLLNYEFSFGKAMVVTSGAMTMVTDVGGTGHIDDYIEFPDEPEIAGAHRINISNYENVKVRYDLRAYDDNGNGISSSTRAQAFIYHSVDGNSFQDDGDARVMDLSGGTITGTLNDFVTDESPKRVLVPTSNIGNTWKNVSFNDASWTAGIKAAGYENSSGYQNFFGPTLDLKSQLYKVNPTLYMRIPFNVTSTAGITSLILSMRYDDGYVAYLNGVEVDRKNSPSGVPAWNAEASATHGDELAEVFQEVAINDHISDLQVGANVLAIHGLNRPDSSSDMLIGAKLVGVSAGGGGGGGGIGEPESLNDISGPLDGSFATFEYEVPDSARTVHMKWQMNCNSGNDALILDNILVSGDPLEVDSYKTWIQITTPYELDDLGQPLEDPDGDTVTNLLEYGFGGVADQPTPEVVPVLGFTEIEGTRYMTMKWRQLNLTTTGGFGDDRIGNFDGYFVRDISYVPEFSTDGENWEDDAVAFLIDLEEGEDDTVEVTVFFDRPLENDLDRAFGRVRVRIEDDNL